jgi:prepilin-type N-terminal cleavage/methylation domain-containing protein
MPRFPPSAPTPRQGLPQAPRNGFTLVELMVVIVIIGLLATVVMINVLPSQDRAMTTKARADIATLGQAMEMYRLDNMRYPPSLDALAQPRPAAAAPMSAACPGSLGPALPVERSRPEQQPVRHRLAWRRRHAGRRE